MNLASTIEQIITKENSRKMSDAMIPSKNKEYYGKIKDYLEVYGKFNINDLVKEGLSNSIAYKYARRLVDAGVLTRRPVDGMATWFLIEPKAEKAPRQPIVWIDDAKEKVLQYINDHDGERYTVTQMIIDTGISNATMYKALGELKKRKLIAPDFNKGATLVGVERPKASSLDDKLDTLVWNFVKDSGSLNVLEFLKYIKAKE